MNQPLRNTFFLAAQTMHIIKLRFTQRGWGAVIEGGTTSYLEEKKQKPDFLLALVT